MHLGLDTPPLALRLLDQRWKLTLRLLEQRRWFVKKYNLVVQIYNKVALLRTPQNHPAATRRAIPLVE
ncbi:hypothetical protein VV02_00135 [Luteipulveratus mongoliensis]|uniref:Uncharacterized protein n=1 Tax=Luteipulveratus mongoliensis TaxID=571913 RepID=A0A0K1JD54_9MICO|nr:hypothetical protein VV02_00135 [Luteipulveratus mongoliensis]